MNAKDPEPRRETPDIDELIFDDDAYVSER